MPRISKDKEGDLQGREDRLRNNFLKGLTGDAQAYHELLMALATHLRAFFRRRLMGAPDEVEDLVQETLLAVHTRRHTYCEDQPFTPWVYAIARYKLVDFFRAQGSRAHVNVPMEDDMDIFTTADRDANDAQRDLDGLLQDLPDKQRLPIMHMKIDGLSVAETARKTGLSESAVKVGVHRGLKALSQLVRRKT
ncbi:sigma-70 family RNA polymerase sigma factor [Rhodoferax sp.]|uniref:sigma-70 family RNA polymerase sigma factor n=1 Tax=Rhodoferax sp. TaxID=50421 RepID=UPI00262FFEA9|nr:sigma-70 family RNA polymerase sigma factor [Rhodoferax sp.]MDD2920426.1 sigma-70 family RNA polymerase sigma factor [Rhodoferax sp.]